MTERETTRAQVVAAVTGAGEDAAVRYAAAEAERLGAPLLVVHVLPLTLPVGPMVLFPEDSFQAHGADVLAAARSTALEAAPGLEVRTDLRAGGRVHELVAAAERAALLVVGRRASHSLDRVWTGGTLTGVVARAACPVTVVPTDWAVGPQPARVVAGFKSSQHAPELLAAAFARAEQLGAELVVLHAWQLPGAYDALAAAEVPDATFNREQKDAVWRAVSETAESLPTVPVRVQVVHAPPAEALAEASRAASLLVLVRPAHGGLVHHLGRTARTVLREARCPVEIVVPTPAADAPVPPLVLEREGHLVR
jgi:nucleotide-binding universal stress UspA family protein